MSFEEQIFDKINSLNKILENMSDRFRRLMELLEAILDKEAYREYTKTKELERIVVTEYWLESYYHEHGRIPFCGFCKGSISEYDEIYLLLIGGTTFKHKRPYHSHCIENHINDKYVKNVLGQDRVFRAKLSGS